MTNNSNQLQVFDFESKNVRVQIIDDKEFFCAKDVTDALGYKNGRDAIKSHCKINGVVKCYIGVTTGKKHNGDDAVQNIEATFISESNVIRLIVNSKLPSAEKFEAWVFEEVLPSIRKTGGYSNKIQIPSTINSDLLFQIANKVKELEGSVIKSEEEKIELQQDIHHKDEVLLKQHTKIKEISDVNGLVGFREMAGGFHIKEPDLRKFLLDNKIIQYLNGKMTAHSSGISRNLSKNKIVINRKIGEGYTQPHFTTKCQELVLREFTKSISQNQTSINQLSHI